jgi:hypothetical protein
MANDSPSSPTGKMVSVFGSDLSLAQQKEQLLKLIADYSERMQMLEDGEEKEIVSRRLVLLADSLAQVELNLSIST